MKIFEKIVIAFVLLAFISMLGFLHFYDKSDRPNRSISQNGHSLEYLVPNIAPFEESGLTVNAYNTFATIEHIHSVSRVKDGYEYEITKKNEWIMYLRGCLISGEQREENEMTKRFESKHLMGALQADYFDLDDIYQIHIIGYAPTIDVESPDYLMFEAFYGYADQGNYRYSVTIEAINIDEFDADSARAYIIRYLDMLLKPKDIAPVPSFGAGDYDVPWPFYPDAIMPEN